MDAQDPGLTYVSAAPGPGRAHGGGFSEAAIYRRREGQWEPVLEGLAEFPYALVADPENRGTVYAGLGDGTILRGSNTGERWEEIARVPGVEALVAVPV